MRHRLVFNLFNIWICRIAKELILLFLRMIEKDESLLPLILPCEGNATSTWMIQILGPCTLNVSCNTRGYTRINTLVCVRPLHARSCCASYKCCTCGVRVHGYKAQCRSTPNIYTSIHPYPIEGRDTLMDVAFCHLSFAVSVALGDWAEDLPNFRLLIPLNLKEKIQFVRMF